MGGQWRLILDKRSDVGVSCVDKARRRLIVARSLVQLSLITSASEYDLNRYLAHLKKELVVSECSILLEVEE